MTSTPFFSIIIPTYNDLVHLKLAILSVLKQGFTDYEILVIDNFSSDGTEYYIDSLSCPSLRYFRISNFGIIAKSRNYGIRKAIGQWICFLDSDDAWAPNKLSVLHSMINDSVHIVAHDAQILPTRTSFIRKKSFAARNVPSAPLIKILQEGNFLVNSTVSVSRSFLITHNLSLLENKDIVAAEDLSLWLQIFICNGKLEYSSSELGYYRIHVNSVSSRRNMSIPVSHLYDLLYPFISHKYIRYGYSYVKYISAQYHISNTPHSIPTFEPMYVLRHGAFYIKLKYLYLMILAFFMRLTS